MTALGGLLWLNQNNNDVAILRLLKLVSSSSRGDAIDLDSFCGNIISECEKTEEVLMNSWFPKITAVFTQNKKKPKGEKLKNFYKCASSLLSIQASGQQLLSLLWYAYLIASCPNSWGVYWPGVFSAMWRYSLIRGSCHVLKWSWCCKVTRSVSPHQYQRSAKWFSRSYQR